MIRGRGDCISDAGPSYLPGGHVRMRMRMSTGWRGGKPASSKKELVEKGVAIVRSLGDEPATSVVNRDFLYLR